MASPRKTTSKPTHSEVVPKTTSDLAPLSLAERQEREREKTTEWLKKISRRQGKTRFVLRDAKNKQVLDGTEFECRQTAKAMWSRFDRTHDRGLAESLPRILIKIDGWGDELPVEQYPSDQKILWQTQEGTRAA